jgi:hypothetical protein
MSKFRVVGKAIINTERLLLAGFANDEDSENNRALLAFDNGQRLYLEMGRESSLLELVSLDEIQGGRKSAVRVEDNGAK